MDARRKEQRANLRYDKLIIGRNVYTYDLDKEEVVTVREMIDTEMHAEHGAVGGDVNFNHSPHS